MKRNIIIIIMTIIILILGGYLVFDKVLVDENVNNIENQQEENITEEKSLITEILEFYPSSIAVVNDGEVYVNVYGSTQEIDNLYGAGSYQVLLNTRNNYQEYSFNNVKVLNELNETFRGIKLKITDVKEVYSYANGQALSPNYGLFILKNDNTVYGISLYSLINGKTTPTLIALNNISHFTSKNNVGYSTYAVDKNGNEYDMSKYIPQDYKAW